MEKSRKINGWKAKNFKIKTEAGKHSRSNLLTTYDKVLRLQCILCSEGMYPASWELTIHRRMKKSRVVYCKKNFFWGARCLAWIFVPLHRTRSRSWMSNPLPQPCLAKTQISGAILPRVAANERSEIEPPKETGALHPAFFGSVAQLRFACLPLAFLDRWLNCASLVCHWAARDKCALHH